jgi:NADPH:quinone reductase-like Zn-dependent oxidoreductase
MKTIVYKEFGGASVLQTIEEAKPSVKADQVLVKVKAVSINPLDWKIRKGEMKLMSGSKFPKHTGIDFAGIIEETGSAVTNVKKGDEIFGTVKNNMKEGALGEYIAVPFTHVWRKPGNINFVQAAAIPAVGFAAAMTLEKIGNVSTDSRILINGAAGGFGMFLLQLLKSKGANTTAVVGTSAIATALEWGATSVVDYKREDVFSKGIYYDAVIDLSGKMSYTKAKQIMKPRSVFINPTPQPVDILISPVKNLFRGKKHIVLLSTPSEKYSNVLLNAIDTGLKIKVSKVFPFAQSKEAYTYAEQGGTIGKIAIELD